MEVLQQGQGDSSMARFSRPHLILDTQFPSRSVVDDPCAQSAPVGTRQEKGIAPLYQAGDRHCAKLAEMMDSPTWRSQNTGPILGYHNIQLPLLPHEQAAQAVQHQKGNVIQTVRSHYLPNQSSCDTLAINDVVHLGRCSDDIKILGIQPFPEIRETSDNAFIISAAISRDVSRPHEPFFGETLEDDESSDNENSAQSPLPPVGSPGEIQIFRNGKGPRLDHDAQSVMERDDAIHSINHSLRSPNRRRQVASDEQRRFRGLLDRLHQRQQGEVSKDIVSKDAVPFVDPAIIACIPKKADPGTPTKQSARNRSDSGYASPSVYSRPSTRTQSRLGREGSSSADSEVIRIEHHKDGSHDSGFDESPSKNSMLNPMAKEFSVSRINKGSPAKQGLSTRPPISSKLFVPSQKFQRMLEALSDPQIDSTITSSQNGWYPPQVNVSDPFMASGFIQQGHTPGFLPQWNSITGACMPSATGMNSIGPCTFSGMAPGLGQASGPGLAGLTGLAGLNTGPGLGATNVAGAFHHQLSNLGLCCNPAHQSISTFSSPSLPTFVPPNIAPQTPGPPVPLSALTPSAAPFIPKNVPKPKVPNTTGQQNWELMHELRRMNEPGYAQKCKEKQKKRYMRQLEKTIEHS